MDAEVQCGRGNDDARRVRYPSPICTNYEIPNGFHMRYEYVSDVWVVQLTEYRAFVAYARLHEGTPAA